jgi:hypothetical protein
MKGKPPQWHKFLAPVVLAIGLGGAPGCLWSNHTLVPLSAHCLEACESVPEPCRSKVYVFLLSGFDPLGFDGIASVRATLARAGFRKVYDGQFFHSGWFAEEMRRIHAEEPEARFAVVGIGAGVESAAGLAAAVATDGITIDLLASVDAPFWSSAAGSHPTNVQQVLSVYGLAQLGPTADEAGAVLEVPTSSWFGVATHPLTLDRLARELAQVAGAVPGPAAEPTPPAADAAPTPRPVTVLPHGPRDEWDFLKPVVRLSEILPPSGESTTTAPMTGDQAALR